jgi:hypothetical protein
VTSGELLSSEDAHLPIACTQSEVHVLQRGMTISIVMGADCGKIDVDGDDDDDDDKTKLMMRIRMMMIAMMMINATTV